VIIKLAMMVCYFLSFLNVLKCCYLFCYAMLVAITTIFSVASFVNVGFDRKVTGTKISLFVILVLAGGLA